MKKLFVLLTISIFVWQSGYTQTYVSGGIYTNTIWTLANSPYIVTGDLVLFPTYSLTIKPGVLVKFYDSVGFEVRGTLIASGTPNDSISIISSSSNPSQGIWRGIFINNNLGGTGTFRYSLIKDAKIGIKNICCHHSDTLMISNCKFENNSAAIGGYGGENAIVSIDSCYFIHNNHAITSGDKVIKNSTFVYNNYGLFETERTNIYDCNFCGNRNAVCGTAGQMTNTIVMNNGIGVQGTVFGDLSIITGNIIAQNDTGILLSGNYIGFNNIICNNYYYNIISTTSENLSVINQCWCLTDSISIANKIYDGYDDPQLGLISFIPFINCDASVLPDTSYCPDIPAGIIQPLQTNNIFIKISPNPFAQYTILEFENLSNEKHYLLVYNSIGQLKASINDIINGLLKFKRESLPIGLYFFQVRTINHIVATGKFVIE